jgi:hypothetical protein
MVFLAGYVVQSDAPDGNKGVVFCSMLASSRCLIICYRLSHLF